MQTYQDFLWNAEGSINFLEPSNDREFQVVVSSRKLNGTSDAYSVANRLKDTSVDFTTSLEVGDVVINTTTGETTTVAQVSSATIIKLSGDIFSADGGGEKSSRSKQHAESSELIANDVILITKPFGLFLRYENNVLVGFIIPNLN